MEQRELPGTSLTVSRLCLGTMTFGSQADAATAAAMVDVCLDAGLNFIDTANVYNNGQSEQLLGTILRNRRDKVVLASKVFGKMGEGLDQSGLSAQAIRRAIDESLSRLQTDYLDIYYLHQPDYSVPMEETLEAMDRLVQSGKVRYAGTSNYASWQICRAHWLAEVNGYQGLALTQPMYNLLARGIEQELLPMCRDLNVATVAYNPLAGGILTGKHQPDTVERGTRFDGNQQYLDRYWHQANFDAIEQLKSIARDNDRSLPSVAINWLLHHTAIDCVILGASKMDQLHQNLTAAGQGPLPPDLVAACDSLWNAVRGVSPKYNR